MVNPKQPDLTRDQRLMVFLSRGLPIPDHMSLAPLPSGDTPRKSEPVAWERVQDQIVRLKAATFTTWARDRAFQAGMAFVPASEGTWQDLSETGKAAVLDSWIDWNGISRRDKRIEFTKHLDGSKLPQEVAEQFLDMAKDRALDKGLPAAEKQHGKKSLADLKAASTEKKPARQKSRDGIER